MKAYKLAIFDLDGTLLDTLQDLANSTNYALCAMGFPTRRIDEVRSFVGNGIKKLIERAVPTGTPSEDIEKTLSIFKSYYADHCEDKTKPYNGIMALLDRLKEENVLIAVVSNKIDSAVSVLCEKYFGDLLETGKALKRNQPQTLCLRCCIHLILKRKMPFTLATQRWIFKLPKTLKWTVFP